MAYQQQNYTPPSEPEDYKDLERHPKVVLSYDAAQSAVTVGVKRRIQSLQFAKNPDRHKRPHNPARMWKNDIEGAVAELAFSQFLGVEWNAGINTFKQPDVLDYQVRSTTIPGYSLVVRQKDSDYDKYVLVIGYSMYMWDFHPPTYYLVPQSELNSSFEDPAKPTQNEPGVYLPDNIGNRV